MNLREPDERLESWKEIAGYLQRDARTVRNWEKDEGLPVHRHSHKSRSSVYAYRSEIDAWRAGRKVSVQAPPPPPLWRGLLKPSFVLTMVLCLIMAGNGLRPQVVAAQTLTARQIPVDASEAWSFSPDGSLMATTEWDKGGGDLVIREVGTGRDKVLQKGACVERGKPCVFADTPLLSPDLKQVAYSWYDDNENDGRGQLRVIANETGATPRVLVRTAELSSIWPSAWSPDGKSILATIRENDRTWWRIAWVSTADGKITVIKTLHLGPGDRLSRLSLSPDGKYIVYTAPLQAGSAVQHVFVLSSDGSSEVPLTKGAGINEAPVWTPDGQHVLYVSNQAGSFDLWATEVRGGKPYGITSVVKRDVRPRNVFGVTSSGALLYEVARTDAYDTLAEIRQSKSAMTLRPTEKFVGRFPTWSPDGKLIAFGRLRSVVPATNELVVRSIATGEERIYSHAGLIPAPPSWAQDRKSVVVAVRNDKAQVSFHRLDLANGQFTELVPADASYAPGGIHQLSPNGQQLYINARNAEKTYNIDHVIAYDLKTGRRKVVFSSPAHAIVYFFSPDGRRLAIRSEDSAVDGKVRFGVANADWSDYHEIYSAPLKEVSGRVILCWAPDGRSLLFGKPESARDDEGHTLIMSIPIGGGQPKFTGLRISTHVLAMASAGDGLHVALVSQESTSELWSLDNVLSAVK
jgi:Tol biopolymer transport system component